MIFTRCIAAVLLAVGTVEAKPPLYVDRTLEREGIELQVRVGALGPDAEPTPVMGQKVNITLTAKRLADGEPLMNWEPGAWLDTQVDPMSGAVPVCSRRIARFLSGDMIQRPLIDLTGYFVLTLDAEKSISVLDPAVNFSGRSSLYTAMELEGRGFDWVKTEDDTKAFVALPEASKLAIVDIQAFEALGHLPMEGRPTRLALSENERLLWIGQTGQGTSKSRVDILDTLTDEVVGGFPLPEGHHEFAFSEDGQFAYITSREAGTVTMVDAIGLRVLKTQKIGGQPLSVVFDDRGGTLWVADGERGKLHRFDAKVQALDTISLNAGVGPMRLSPNGETILVLNPQEHRLYILDSIRAEVTSDVTLSGQPYDLLFSEQYMYVRSLASEQVATIALAELRSESPHVQYVPMGETALASAEGLPRASSMSVSFHGTGAFFAAPAERTVYHYMEGMNAPDTGLKSYGHTPMATMVVRRGFREVAPGVYESTVAMPSAGRLMLALSSRAPMLSECFGLEVRRSRTSDEDENHPTVQWLSEPVMNVVQGEPFELTLALKGRRPEAKSSPKVVVMSSRGGEEKSLRLKKGSNRQWSASGSISRAGSYYLHVEGEPDLKGAFATIFVTEPEEEEAE